MKKKSLSIISIAIFCLLLVPICFRYGGKYEFNPYSIKNRERKFIDIRFGGIEIFSWITGQGQPSWLKDRLDELGYDNYSEQDYWIQTGVWYLGKLAEFNGLIDIKGPVNSKCFRYMQDGDKEVALAIWGKEIEKLKNENKKNITLKN